MVVNSALRQPLIIAMMMMLAQQLSGINAAMFYSTKIFQRANLSEDTAQAATLGMGTINVLMTFVSLVLIEKAGRKTLMIVGLAVMCVSTTILMFCVHFTKGVADAASKAADASGVCLYTREAIEAAQESAGGQAAEMQYPVLSYLSIPMVIIFVIGFATGPGSIPWFFVTELFNQSARPLAASVAVPTNWAANFLVGLLFDPLQSLIEAWVFVIFIVLQILFIVYIKFKVPETKNKTIEEITSKFH